MAGFSEKDMFLVTGASSGLGKAVAFGISQRGGSVVAAGRNEEKLLQVKNSSACPNRFFTEQIDLGENLEKLSEWPLHICRKYGRKLKGLILAAGIQNIAPIKAMNLAKAKKLFDINYFANMQIMKGFIDPDCRTGEGESVVLFSSIAAMTGNPGLSDYGASKGAVLSAVKTLAVELARQKIRVNAVLPGLVRTPMIESQSIVYNANYLAELDKKYPLGPGKPEYIADAVCFLLSSDSAWITGTGLTVDGGASLVT